MLAIAKLAVEGNTELAGLTAAVSHMKELMPDPGDHAARVGRLTEIAQQSKLKAAKVVNKAHKYINGIQVLA